MNEVRFKIGADTSSLSRGFAQAQSVAAVAGKAIEKKLGLKDAFKSTVLALGIGIDKIAEKIAEMWTGGSQEAWRSSLNAAQEASRIIEESTLKRMNTLRQIEQLEKDIRRNAAQEDATPKKQEGFLSRMMNSPLAALTTLGASRGLAKLTGVGQETPADAHARAQEATAKRLAAEAKIEELKEKQAADVERVEAAMREISRLGMDDEGKALALQQEMEAAYAKVNEAARKGADTTALHLAALAKEKSLQEHLLAIEKKQTEEAEKQKRARADFLDKYRQSLKAQDKVGEARKNLGDARHDALALGVDEAASGARGTSADRARARAIQRDEAKARQLFGSGRTVTEFNSATQRNESRGAQFFQNRAEQMRQGFGRAKTDEQRPFAGLEEQFKEANQYLYEIQESLKPTESK